MKQILGLGGRKFILSIAIIVLTSIFLAVGKLAGAEFVAVVLGVAGLFFGANVLQGKKDGK